MFERILSVLFEAALIFGDTFEEKDEAEDTNEDTYEDEYCSYVR